MAKAKYKKGKDGYFQARVWNGNYVNGKKQYVSIRSKISSKDLENKVNEHNQKLKERKYVKSTNMTFYQYAVFWLNTYKVGRAKNTIRNYRNVINCHFALLNNVMLNDISRIHYQTALNNAEGHNSVKQIIHITFKQVIKSAISDKYLPANVLNDIFDSIDPIRYKPPEKRPLEKHEKEAVFRADFNDCEKVFVYIIYGCGLRRGEVLALQKENIDLKKKTITVKSSLQHDVNTPYIKEPKSKNGYRTVPIPDKIFGTIESYVNSLNGDRLFITRRGKRAGDWLSKSGYDSMWAYIVKKMQATTDEPIVGLTAHVFRHNYCTSLCYQIPTISIKKIAELMGDTDKMIIDVYNHIMLEKENAEEAVNAAINF